ncbi:phospholipase D-like domain-containing protein [Pontibacter arcticus]|uniref:PLD phosphodiesterase domain-containing protein n=1 Tax=Pontibacter arcticus TaxID=2080288 RepID=A0A364RID2_9BACT|nr:phospholipase D-like domain-containing protein [Pontibacter arcticus]RAU84062.1 hypothetical protein DP923_03145 [Pontibacter arcticus]
MKPEVHFVNIREVIIREIKRSEESIKIAMAWFTDKELFDALLERSKKKSIKIELILNNDAININSEIQFEHLFVYGGNVYFPTNEEKLMHNKFCIIDSKKVLNGSFNWTNKANYNNENLTIYDDVDFAAKFINEFESLKRASYSIEKLLDIEELQRFKEEEILTINELKKRAFNRRDIKNHTAALRDCIRIYEAEVSWVNYLEIAQCYIDLKKLYAAIQIYSEYLEGHQTDAKIFNLRGSIYLETDQLELAIFDFTQAISINNQEPEYYENRAKAYVKPFDFFSTNDTLNRMYPDYYHNGFKGVQNLYSYFYNLTYDNKIKPLEEKKLPWILNYPSWDTFESALAGFEGLGEQALNDYHAAIQLKSINTATLYEKIARLQGILSYSAEQQVIAYSNCIKYNPDNLHHYFWRGICYKIIKKYPEALLDFETVLSVNPNHSSCTSFYKQVKDLMEKEKEIKVEKSFWKSFFK